MQVAGLSERHPGQAIVGQRGRVEPDPLPGPDRHLDVASVAAEVALHDGLTGQHGQVQRPEVAGVAAVLPASAQTALGELEAAGLAAGSGEGNGRASYWSPTTPSPDADRAGDSQPG